MFYIHVHGDFPSLSKQIDFTLHLDHFMRAKQFPQQVIHTFVIPGGP